MPLQATPSTNHRIRGNPGYTVASYQCGAALTRFVTKLRPTEVLIFGNPQGGTPFMECGQTVGIDLPQKALVWEDASGTIWLGYNDPTYLAERHSAAQCPVVADLKQALAGIAQATVAK